MIIRGMNGRARTSYIKEFKGESFIASSSGFQYILSVYGSIAPIQLHVKIDNVPVDVWSNILLFQGYGYWIWVSLRTYG